MRELLVERGGANAALQAVGVVNNRILFDEAQLLVLLLSNNFQDLDHLVVDAHCIGVLVFLLLRLVALRKGKARLTREQESI